jgi:hypothetical protein
MRHPNTFLNSYTIPKPDSERNALPFETVPLLDRHPAWHWCRALVVEIRHLVRLVRLPSFFHHLALPHAAAGEVGSEAFSEVRRALDAHTDGNDNQRNIDGRKGGQWLRNRLIVLASIAAPDTCDLEDEVCQAGEVKDLNWG